MSDVVFQGPGPFHLPAAQRATAIVVANTAQVILYVQIPGNEEPQAVNCQMIQEVARELGVRLIAASNVLEAQGK